MTIQFGHVILRTRYLQEYVNALSELLDMKVHHAGQEVLLEGLNLKILLKQHEKKSPAESSHLQFFVDNEQQLDQLAKQLDFYNYKRHNDPFLRVFDMGKDYLTLRDKEGRFWYFSCAAKSVQ